MSRSNVRVVEEGLCAFNSADMERILAFIHPEFEGSVPPEFSAEPDTYRGHDGIRRYFRTFQDAMEEVRFQPERFWDAGDAVVVEMRLTARGRQTSIPVEQRFAQVWTVRDSQATAVTTHATL